LDHLNSRLSNAGFRAFSAVEENGFIEGAKCFAARFRGSVFTASSRKCDLVPRDLTQTPGRNGYFWERGFGDGVLFPQPLKRNTHMLVKPIIVASALVFASSAFAQGVSEKTPGHKMQDATKSTAPGASEYAPGHKMQNAKKSTAPGASEYTPSHTTTGSSTKL